MQETPDQAFDVWVRRRTWVDDQLKVFQGMTRQETIIPGNPPITVPDLAAMLAAMSQPVSYPATGAAVPIDRVAGELPTRRSK